MFLVFCPNLQGAYITGVFMLWCSTIYLICYHIHIIFNFLKIRAVGRLELVWRTVRELKLGRNSCEDPALFSVVTGSFIIRRVGYIGLSRWVNADSLTVKNVFRTYIKQLCRFEGNSCLGKILFDIPSGQKLLLRLHSQSVF